MRLGRYDILKISFEIHFGRLTRVTSCVYIIGEMFTIHGRQIFTISWRRAAKDIYSIVQRNWVNQGIVRIAGILFSFLLVFPICVFSRNRCLHGDGAHVYSIRRREGCKDKVLRPLCQIVETLVASCFKIVTSWPKDSNLSYGLCSFGETQRMQSL